MAELSVDGIREIGLLEAELRRLEADDNMFLGGRLPHLPWEPRSVVERTAISRDRVIAVVTLNGLMRERDKVQTLFGDLVIELREAGQHATPFLGSPTSSRGRWAPSERRVGVKWRSA